MFDIKVSRIDGFGYSIVVEDFHARWKEAAQKLLKGRIKEMMREYACQMGLSSGIPVDVEFHEERGLTHIVLPDRIALDLNLDRGERAARYISHNASTMAHVGLLVSTISAYLSWMNFALRDIERER